uniref:Uncharacterized protein n=1 Tax=Glossina brevipalpis TaxID=37001 RepID=A0A1A9WR52_9MUSC
MSIDLKFAPDAILLLRNFMLAFLATLIYNYKDLYELHGNMRISVLCEKESIYFLRFNNNFNVIIILSGCGFTLYASQTQEYYLLLIIANLKHHTTIKHSETKTLLSFASSLSTYDIIDRQRPLATDTGNQLGD